MNAETFNALYPVGTPVFAYPGARPEAIPSARRIVTRTRTEAKSVGLDREGVVWVEDHGAYIALSHVDVAPEGEWAAAKEAADLSAAVRAASPVRLTPEREAEIRERAPKRTAEFTEWLNRFSPMPGGDAADHAETVLEEDVPALLGELDAVRGERDRYRTAYHSASFRAEARGEGIVRIVGERESYQGWLKQEQECTQRLRAELDARNEDLAFLERNTLPELRRTIQHHEDGKKRWRKRAEKAEAHVRELERPVIEKRRAEIRSSYVEAASQAEQDRDYEGAANVAQLLADAEAKWQREDEEASS